MDSNKQRQATVDKAHSKYNQTDDDLYRKHRKHVYFYWFKFLRLAEESSEHKVNWSKYRSWGSKNAVMSMKFDDWWKQYWIDCFSTKVVGETAKYDTSRRTIKVEPLRFKYYVTLYAQDTTNAYEIAKRIVSYQLRVSIRKFRSNIKFRPKLHRRDQLRDYFNYMDNYILSQNLNPKTTEGHSKRGVGEMHNRLMSVFEIEYISETKNMSERLTHDWTKDIDKDFTQEVRNRKRRLQDTIATSRKQGNLILKNVCNGIFP